MCVKIGPCILLLCFSFVHMMGQFSCARICNYVNKATFQSTSYPRTPSSIHPTSGSFHKTVTLAPTPRACGAAKLQVIALLKETSNIERVEREKGIGCTFETEMGKLLKPADVELFDYLNLYAPPRNIFIPRIILKWVAVRNSATFEEPFVEHLKISSHGAYTSKMLTLFYFPMPPYPR